MLYISCWITCCFIFYACSLSISTVYNSGSFPPLTQLNKLSNITWYSNLIYALSSFDRNFGSEINWPFHIMNAQATQGKDPFGYVILKTDLDNKGSMTVSIWLAFIINSLAFHKLQFIDFVQLLNFHSSIPLLPWECLIIYFSWTIIATIIMIKILLILLQ